MKCRTFIQGVFLAFIIGGLIVPLRAQSLPFLQIAVDSRSAAMGEVQLASPGQAMTIFTNPAGLASVSGLQLATTATNWLLDLRQYGGAAAVPIAGVGTVGLSTVWMDYGTFDRTIPSAGAPDGYRTTGTFSVAEYAVGLAYARPVTPQWFVGGQVKVVGQRLPAGGLESGNAGQTFFLGDVGTIYTPGWHDLRVGLAATNLARTPGIPEAASGSGCSSGAAIAWARTCPASPPGWASPCPSRACTCGPTMPTARSVNTSAPYTGLPSGCRWSKTGAALSELKHRHLRAG